MFGHSKAFAAYRSLSQTHLDFVVVVCHAMPALQADIALPIPALTHKPDHFKAARNPKAWVESRCAVYQDELSRSTLITGFSYFEAYVKDALREIVDFHGGVTKFRSLARDRSVHTIRSLSPMLLQHKRKLQDNPSPVKLAKYQKYGRILDKSGFRFPTDLMSNFGARYLVEKLDEKRGMRAWEIPDVLEDCLLLSVDADDRKTYEGARALRNKFAHGASQKLPLKTSLRYCSELHSFAAKIDKHIIEHFFVIQAV